jgi:hypothetical protein
MARFGLARTRKNDKKFITVGNQSAYVRHVQSKAAVLPQRELHALVRANATQRLFATVTPT